MAQGPVTFASCEYADELRIALLAYKERGIRGLDAILAGYLGDAIDVAVRAIPNQTVMPVLVSVPSTRAAARRRGGDHMRRLSRIVASEANLQVLPVLRLVGSVADSAGLSPAQRTSNLNNRMVAGWSRPGDDDRPVVIVDDIVTTGTSLAEARRALEAADWPVMAAAVVGATRRRWPASSLRPLAHRRSDRAPTEHPHSSRVLLGRTQELG